MHTPNYWTFYNYIKRLTNTLKGVNRIGERWSVSVDVHNMFKYTLQNNKYSFPNTKYKPPKQRNNQMQKLNDDYMTEHIHVARRPC